MKRFGLLAALAAALLVVQVERAEAGKGKRPRVRVGVGLHLDLGHPSRAGHYETRQERVLVPGHYELQWVERREPDRYEWRTERVWVPGGTTVHEERVYVGPGRWEMRYRPGCQPPFQRVWIPPQYETRRVPVEQPGHWEMRRTRVVIPGAVRSVQERVWIPASYEYRNTQVWVPGAVCAPRVGLAIGGNHGGFGFSLSLLGR